MKDLIQTLNRIIDLHECMKGAYFFTPPNDAQSRRRYEDKHTLYSEFEYKGNRYYVKQETTCSCRNVYYKISYYENNNLVYKDIRFIKRILKECEKQCPSINITS